MKVLVIGADGNIGRALLSKLTATGCQAIGTSRSAHSVASGHLFLDLAAPDVAKTALPPSDVAFFCAAMTRFADCRSNPVLARQINATAPAELAQRLVDQGTRVVLLSTSAVFNGKRPLVESTAAPSPISFYGRFKAEAEQAFLELGRCASVVRMSKVLIPSAPLMANWIAQLADGRQVDAFADLYLAPVALEDAVAALMAVMRDKDGGIFQISGSRDISYFDAAKLLAQYIHGSEKLAMPCSALTHGIPPEEAPRFTSLDVSRIATLTGLPASNPESVIKKVFGKLIANACERYATRLSETH